MAASSRKDPILKICYTVSRIFEKSWQNERLFFFPFPSFHIGYCVIGCHNTGYGDDKAVKKYPRPKLYGVAVNVETGDIFPADFPDDSKGPDADLRHVRCGDSECIDH